MDPTQARVSLPTPTHPPASLAASPMATQAGHAAGDPGQVRLMQGPSPALLLNGQQEECQTWVWGWRTDLVPLSRSDKSPVLTSLGFPSTGVGVGGSPTQRRLQGGRGWQAKSGSHRHSWRRHRLLGPWARAEETEPGPGHGRACLQVDGFPRGWRTEDESHLAHPRDVQTEVRPQHPF